MSAVIENVGVFRPELNGFHLKDPSSPAIYLILDGQKCHIPNLETYGTLFRANPSTISDTPIETIADGPSLSNGATVAQAAGHPEFYLVTNQVKRHIANPKAVNDYQFRGDPVILPKWVLDLIPDGKPIHSR